MSKRWKPGLNEVFWYINSGNKIDHTTNNGFGCDEEKIAAGNCFFTEAQAKAAAEKVKALLLSLHDEPVTECNQLPKLTAEVFDRPDCPEWAKYAAVDSNGDTYYFEQEPYIDAGQWKSENIKWQYIYCTFDPTDWQNSLIERPAKLPEWCKVGEWVYCTQTGNYGKILSVDAEQVNIQLSSNETFSAKTNMMLKYGKAARLRPYNADEMRGLVGKVVTTSSGRHCTLVTACKQEYSVIEPQVMLNKWLYATDLLNGGNTIDGKPCGKLEHFENGEWVE